MKIKAIALNTFKEAIRDRILYLLFFFAIAALIFSRLLALLTVGDRIKIITDVGLASLSLFGALMAILMGTGLVYKEIDDFDLLRALNNGLLPRHYLSGNARKLLSAYTGSYLRDEIMAEAKIRKIRSFSRFLEIAAFSNGEIVNYSNIAADCGVSAPTIREYFQILEDTLIGRFLPSFQK